MKLLANENFPKASVEYLRSLSFDVKFIGEDFAGFLDEEVMGLAIEEQRTILTFDSDYGELIFKKGYRPQAGVIYLRWDNFQPEEPGHLIAQLIGSSNLILKNALTVLAKNHIRQRKY